MCVKYKVLSKPHDDMGVSMVLISVSVAFIQTPAYAERIRGQYIVWSACLCLSFRWYLVILHGK